MKVKEQAPNKMIRHVVILVLLLLAGFAPGLLASDQMPDDAISWRSETPTGDVVVHLYFFHSLQCPHCQDARPFVESMPQDHAWLKVHSLEISKNPEHADLYKQMAALTRQQAKSVPAFFVCGQMLVGWDSAEGMGKALLQAAQQCRAGENITQPGISLDHLPVFAERGLDNLSLPMFTLVIAALDAFNPCAFFILLFLLSLLVHAHSRKRMLLVGMTFVGVSGLIYFMFMAAWLNLFLLLESMPYITTFSGLLACIIGVINSRDYFHPHKEATLGISQTAKPALFKRMGKLISVDHLPTLLLGTITLAVAVNGYELLCTAGFPMVYTRALTIHQLDTAHYYLYLALYNFIYIIPLMLIVSIFALTLGARKLTRHEGRLLKLLSGIMMLLLGLVLMLAPQLLNSAIMGVALLALSLLIVFLIWLKTRKVSKSAHPS